MNVSEREVARMTQLRRDLHRIPELDDDLPKTLAYVRSVLDALPGATVFEPSRSAVCAFFDAGTPHATALRSDMDALPVAEESGAAFASEHPGCMHACGHDGHMAMLLAAAEWIAANKDQLTRSVLLVFQPAEETTGGAQRICESGVFERYAVDRIFGFHLWPDLPFGQVGSRAGALLASSNEIDVRFGGRSAHIAKWQDGADALAAAAGFAAEVRARMDAQAFAEPALLRFGKLEAGTVRNAIAADALVEGSLRTFAQADKQAAFALIQRTADEAAARYDCSVQIRFGDDYPPVVNDATLFEEAQRIVPELVALPEPLLIAEDFSFYQQALPGVFLLLGTGTGIPLHASTWNFDEHVLAYGLDIYKRLVTA